MGEGGWGEGGVEEGEGGLVGGGGGVEGGDGGGLKRLLIWLRVGGWKAVRVGFSPVRLAIDRV